MRRSLVGIEWGLSRVHLLSKSDQGGLNALQFFSLREHHFILLLHMPFEPSNTLF